MQNSGNKIIVGLYGDISMDFTRGQSFKLLPRGQTRVPMTKARLLKVSMLNIFLNISRLSWLCPLAECLNPPFIHPFIHSGHFYSASSSSLLLRSAPDAA